MILPWADSLMSGNGITRHDTAEDLVGIVEDTGKKNGTTTLLDIRNVDEAWGSDVEGNRDGTVVANEAFNYFNHLFFLQKFYVPKNTSSTNNMANQDTKLMDSILHNIIKDHVSSNGPIH